MDGVSVRLAEVAAEWSKARESSVHYLWRERCESGIDSDAVERVGEVFAAIPGDLSTMDVLDYAAGPGRLSVVLASRFRQVTLADINPDFLELARSRFERVGLSNFETVLIEEPLPSPDVFGRSFDVVVSDLFLSHLPVESVPGFLSLFRELLNPGGWLLIGQPIYDTERNPRNWQDISTWTLEMLERFAADAGLEVVEAYPNPGVFTFRGEHSPNHFRLHVLRRSDSG